MRHINREPHSDAVAKSRRAIPYRNRCGPHNGAAKGRELLVALKKKERDGRGVRGAERKALTSAVLLCAAAAASSLGGLDRSKQPLSL